MRSLLSLLVALGAVACGGAASPPVAPPPAASVPAQATEKKPEDDSARKTAALEALTSEEAGKSACDADHARALEKLLADVEAGMKAKTGEDGKPLGLQLVTKRVLPLGARPRGIEMSVSGKGTELHVMAYGARDISLDVLQGTAAATTLRSPFQRTPTTSPLSIELPKIGAVTDLQSDSRQVQIKPGQPLEVRLTGQGCAGLVAFLKP